MAKAMLMNHATGSLLDEDISISNHQSSAIIDRSAAAGHIKESKNSLPTNQLYKFYQYIIMPSNNSRSLVIACLCLVLMAATHVNAFAPHPLSSRIQKQQQRAQGTSPFVTTTTTATSSTSTQLQERQWNFNEGQGPFGLKKNAEIWNGRVAQVSDLSSLYCTTYFTLRYCT